MPRIETDTLIEITEELVNRPSVNPGDTERAVVDYLKEWFNTSPVPFDVRTNEVFADRPNIVAQAGNPQRGSFLLTGHTDVVPAESSRWTGDPFILRREDDRVIGRGTADMKGGLAAQLTAAEAYLHQAETPGEVILAFVVDEENGGTGTEVLVEEGLSADVAVIGEPTELNVCTAQFGCSRYRLCVRGKSAHAGRPELGENTIDATPQLLQAVAALNGLMSEYPHPLLGTGSVTPTELHAGIAHNIVPDELELTLDWRFPPDISDDPTWFDDHLTEQLAVHAPELEVKSDRYNFYPAVSTDQSHPIVHLMLSAAQKAGYAAEVSGFPAGSDARFLVPDGGIPTVLFGPGSITQDAHTVDESVAVQSLQRAAETYLETLNMFFDQKDSAEVA